MVVIYEDLRKEGPMGTEVTRILSEAKRQGRAVLTEVESKEVLTAYGIPVRTGQVAIDPESAAEIAGKLGYPVVMKIVSPDIPHKSDVGGVRVNLGSAEAVRSAFTDIVRKARLEKPKADIQGVLIYQMVPGRSRTGHRSHLQPPVRSCRDVRPGRDSC